MILKFTFFALLFPLPLIAQTLWSDFSVSFLKGSHYEVGDNNRTVVTLEHAAGYSWGDSFVFLDRLDSDNGDKETYVEISPRFTLLTYENRFINNIYLSTTAELGEGFSNYLVGVGTNIKVPHFKFFKANLYHKTFDHSDNAIQATLSWAVPIGPLTYDGFIDYVSATKTAHTTMNFTSQLKYDISSLMNIKTKFYVGVEYAHWDNKFGIKGVDERNVNLLIKYHF